MESPLEFTLFFDQRGSGVHSTGFVTASKRLAAGLVEGSPKLDGQCFDSTAQSRGSNMRS